MTTAKMRVGVIGIGLMGTAITQRLLEHDFSVFMWNRSRNKAEGLIEQDNCCIIKVYEGKQDE